MTKMAASLRHIRRWANSFHFMFPRCMYPHAFACKKNNFTPKLCLNYIQRPYSGDSDFFGLEEHRSSVKPKAQSQTPKGVQIKSKRKLDLKGVSKYATSDKSTRVHNVTQGEIHETPFGSIRYDRQPELAGEITSKPVLGMTPTERTKQHVRVSQGSVIESTKNTAISENQKSNMPNSYIEEQYFPTLDEMEVPKGPVLNDKSLGIQNVGETVPIAQGQASVDVNESSDHMQLNEQNLSYVDAQYFDTYSPSNIDTASSDFAMESIASKTFQNNDDFRLSQINSKLSSHEPYIEKGYNKSGTMFSNAKQESHTSFIDDQYFEYSGQFVTENEQMGTADTEVSTVNSQVANTSVKPVNDWKDNQNNRSTEPSIVSNFNKVFKEKGKPTELSKFKFSYKDSNENTSTGKEDSAYNISKKIRAEFEKKTKSSLYGKMDPGEYDSKGFRILTRQVPDFHNIPSVDIIKLLRDSIIYDDHDIVAITKPYGLPSHGGPGVQNSVGDLLCDIFPSHDLHLVHRLDKETTGVMLFGKTPEMASKLKDMFYRRQVKKRYLLITKNIPSQPAGMIDIPLSEGTVGNKIRMVLRPYQATELDAIMKKRQPGKEAKTEYRVLDQGEQCALIECRPLTGLKHQIRVHLAFGLNCPILGDHKYSHVDKIAPMRLHPGILNRLKIQQSKVRKLAMHLHARSVLIPEFLDGKHLFISAPLPPHFVKNMSSLKLKLPPGKCRMREADQIYQIDHVRIMEALKGYASDSEKDESVDSESDSCVKFNQANEKGSNNGSDENVENEATDKYNVSNLSNCKSADENAPHGSPCDEREQLIRSSESTSDYFGLLSQDEEVDKTDTITEAISKTINVDGTKVDVEIPGSSFWSSTEFGRTDFETLQKTEKIVQRKCSKEAYSSLPTEATVLHSAPQNVRKRQSVTAIGTRPSIKVARHAESWHAHETRTADLIRPVKDQQVARKLFYIHQKISPFLHSHNVHNQLPKTQEWTNPAHAGAVNRLKWNIPNYSHLLVTCSMDSTVKIWNVWSQLDPCLKILRVHDKAVRDIVWNQDGNRVLTGSYDKSACVTDVETGACVTKLPHTSYVSCVKYHPVRPSMCVTGERDQIQAWDLRSPSVPVTVFSYKDKLGQVQDVMFDKDGSTLFSCSDLVSRDSADRNLMAWDFRTGVVLSNQIYQERYTVTKLKQHPHEAQFLGQTSANYIAIFSLTRPYKLNKHRRYEGHKCLGYNVGFDITPDGQFVYSGSADGKVYCYHYTSGKLYKTLAIGNDAVTDITCHPVLNSTVALCTWGGMLEVWK